jgi:spore coat protein U-like protein
MSESIHKQMLPIRRSSLMGRICTVAALFLWPMAVFENAAEAGTATANLTVQVAITASCTINTATLDFGSNAGTTLISSAINGATTVSVTCTNGSPYSIGMDNGANVSGSQRRMASGANFLNYNLYTDAARLNAWTTAASNSTCTTTSSCFLGTGSGSAQSVNIYGTVPSVGTAPPTGVYTDTVTMTITF